MTTETLHFTSFSNLQPRLKMPQLSNDSLTKSFLFQSFQSLSFVEIKAFSQAQLGLKQTKTYVADGLQLIHTAQNCHITTVYDNYNLISMYVFLPT